MESVTFDRNVGVAPSLSRSLGWGWAAETTDLKMLVIYAIRHLKV